MRKPGIRYVMRAHYGKQFIVLVLMSWSAIIKGCSKPERDTNFNDLVLRSDIVVEATPAENIFNKRGRFKLLFRVTRTMNSKSGNLTVGELFLTGSFGVTNACKKPNFGNNYILFLYASLTSLNERQYYESRYNPIISSARNFQYFKNVIDGKHTADEKILRSGCTRFPKPANSKIVCSYDKVRCRIDCIEGYKNEGGSRFKVCHAATGKWYPAVNPKCILLGNSSHFRTIFSSLRTLQQVSSITTELGPRRLNSQSQYDDDEIGTHPNSTKQRIIKRKFSGLRRTGVPHAPNILPTQMSTPTPLTSESSLENSDGFTTRDTLLSTEMKNIDSSDIPQHRQKPTSKPNKIPRSQEILENQSKQDGQSPRKTSMQSKNKQRIKRSSNRQQTNQGKHTAIQKKSPHLLKKPIRANARQRETANKNFQTQSILINQTKNAQQNGRRNLEGNRMQQNRNRQSAEPKENENKRPEKFGQHWTKISDKKLLGQRRRQVIQKGNKQRKNQNIKRQVSGNKNSQRIRKNVQRAKPSLYTLSQGRNQQFVRSNPNKEQHSPPRQLKKSNGNKQQLGKRRLPATKSQLPFRQNGSRKVWTTSRPSTIKLPIENRHRPPQPNEISNRKTRNNKNQNLRVGILSRNNLGKPSNVLLKTTTSTFITTALTTKATLLIPMEFLNTTIKSTTKKLTTTTQKTKPVPPVFRPLQPLSPRQVSTSTGRKNNENLLPAISRELFTAVPSPPPLPIFQSLPPLRRQSIYPRHRQDEQSALATQDGVVFLKAVAPKEIIGEEIENVDDKFAVASVGDEWETDDGLVYKPELAINKTVFGCPFYQGKVTVFSSWAGGFNAMVEFTSLTQAISNGWIVRIEFERPIVDIETHVVDFYVGTENRKVVTFSPKSFITHLYATQVLTVTFVGRMQPFESLAPKAKAYLLGKCAEEVITGKAVGSMFQGQNVTVDGYGPDSKLLKIPTAANRTIATTEQITVISSTTSTTEQTPPTRALRNRPQNNIVRRPIAQRGGSNTRARGSGNARLRAGRPRSTNFRNKNAWPGSRCLPSSPNGRLPKGGMTRPDWKTSKGKFKYDYNEILHKSLLFYSAQRSGKLVKMFPIPWRGDSALKDGCLSGELLHGGLYNGGGHEKSTMAIAFTTTMLAWGAIDYKAAYTEAGEYDNVIKLIRSNTRYLINCHTAKEELVVQIGDYDFNGSGWSRPEEMNFEDRKIYKIDAKLPGQDVAAETAAALAAASVLFRNSDSKASEECLNHARELLLFARKYPGEYSKTFPAAINNYYSTSGTADELAWAMIWIAKASGQSSFYAAAERIYRTISQNPVTKFDWSEKTLALPILLAKYANKNIYKASCRKMFVRWRRSVIESGQKQLRLDGRGTNMLTANAAFLVLQTAILHKGAPFAANALLFAEQQLHQLLGDGERSFMVGFGKASPRRPRHMASSCGSPPKVCNISVLQISADNVHTLYGALVGGPKENEKYTDLITEKTQNEVAIDFNAGFQSAIVGLKQAKMPGMSLTIPAKTNTIRPTKLPVRKNG